MNLGELIAEYRGESGDTAAPYFVQDSQLTRFANQAVAEACRRGHFLIDSTSPMCSLDVYAGEPVVEIDPRIIDVRRMVLSNSVLPLCPARVEEMDRDNPGWESHAGTPTTYVTDYQTDAIRLYPIPIAAGTVSMTVSRLPICDMSVKADTPEIRKEHHDALVQWLLYRAYSKQDSDMFDSNKAARSLAEFEREFGLKASARNERWKANRHVLDAPSIA